MPQPPAGYESYDRYMGHASVGNVLLHVFADAADQAIASSDQGNVYTFRGVLRGPEVRCWVENVMGPNDTVMAVGTAELRCDGAVLNRFHYPQDETSEALLTARQQMAQLFRSPLAFSALLGKLPGTPVWFHQQPAVVVDFTVDGVVRLRAETPDGCFVPPPWARGERSSFAETTLLDSNLVPRQT